MDKRSKRSREKAFKAFLSLLSQKGYQAISTSEIIEASGIGRATFYKYFKDKEDLLSALCLETFEHVFKSHDRKEAHHDFRGLNDPVSELTHLFTHLKEGRSDLLKAFYADNGDVLSPYIGKYLKAYLPEALNLKEEGELPLELRKAILSSTFLSLLKWWGSQNLKTEPSLLASYYLTSVSFLWEEDGLRPL